MTAETGASADGLDVVTRFAQLRSHVLRVLDAVESHCAPLGPQKDALISSLSLARDSIADRALLLSVVGGEGSGKSTFVNGLVRPGKDDLVPTEATVPGTVAPITLEWSDAQRPEYEVTFQRQSARSVVTRSAKEFAEYLLQKANRHNRKKVAQGIIRLQHPYLESGLRIIDLPGVDGASADVRAQVAEALKSYANAVVGITLERSGYGALIDVFRSYDVDPKRSIVIVNVYPEQMDEDRCRMLNNGLSVPENIEAKRQGCIETFADSGIALDPARVFVVCLFAMAHPEAMGKERLHKAHDAEQAALQEALWALIRQRSAGAVLFDGLGLGVEAVAQVEERLKLLDHVLTLLLSDSPDGAQERAALHSQVAGALDSAQDFKDALFLQERLEEDIRSLWAEHIAAPVAAAQEKMAAFLDLKLLDVRRAETLTRADADRLRKDIELYAEHLSRPIQDARNTALERFIDRTCHHADRITLSVYKDVPVLSALGGDTLIRVDHESFPNLRFSETTPDWFAHAMRAAGGLGSGAITVLGLQGVAASLLATAGVSLNPLVLVPLLFVLGGVSGWMAADRFLRGRKADMTRFLEERQAYLKRLDPGEGGVLYEQWQVAALLVASEAKLALEQVLGDLARLAGLESGDRHALRQQKAHVAAALAGAAAARDELTGLYAQMRQF